VADSWAGLPKGKGDGIEAVRYFGLLTNVAIVLVDAEHALVVFIYQNDADAFSAEAVLRGDLNHALPRQLGGKDGAIPAFGSAFQMWPPATVSLTISQGLKSKLFTFAHFFARTYWDRAALQVPCSASPRPPISPIPP